MKDKLLMPSIINKINESNRINPRNLCGIAKLSHEKELKYLSNFYDFDHTSARIFRVYGKGGREIISRWIHSLLKNEMIQVYNKDNRFDFIHSKDVAKGLIHLAKNNTNPIHNLGSGKSNYIEDVIDILMKKFNNPNIKYIEEPIGKLENSCADMDYWYDHFAGQGLPSISLEEGIKEIIEYERGRLQ